MVNYSTSMFSMEKDKGFAISSILFTLEHIDKIKIKASFYLLPSTYIGRLARKHVNSEQLRNLGS